MTAQHGADRASFAEVVAGNIRAEAARQGFTQVSLALATGMNRTALSYRWRGDRQWQLEDLDVVASVLGITPWDLCRPQGVMGVARSEGFEPPTFWSVDDQDAVVVDLAAYRERVA